MLTTKSNPGLGTETKILMYDGTIKNIKDISVGDILMGNDSTPRTVIELYNGTDEMYEIIPKKGDSIIMNGTQYVSLVCSYKPATHWDKGQNRYRIKYNSMLDNSIKSKSFYVREYGSKEQALHEMQLFQQQLIHCDVFKDITLDTCITKKFNKGGKWLLYRTEVNFLLPKNELLIDPYYLGLWLGDGTSANPIKITNIDQVVIDYIYKYAEELGLKVSKEKITYGIISNGKKRANTLLNYFRFYGLVNNKHVPLIYKTAPRNIRLQILAGLMDTDGAASDGGFEITQKSDVIASDILYLARSCGFAAYSKKSKKGCMYKGEYREGLYNRIFISGDCSDIPTLIPRKQMGPRKMNKDVLHVRIDIKSIGIDNYYGFKLDGNEKFILDDFTVI